MLQDVRQQRSIQVEVSSVAAVRPLGPGRGGFFDRISCIIIHPNQRKLVKPNCFDDLPSLDRLISPTGSCCYLRCEPLR